MDKHTAVTSYRHSQVSELKALIGYFDLDPNRVAQLVHLAYAAQPGNATFQRLLVPGALFSADAVRCQFFCSRRSCKVVFAGLE